MRIQYIKAQKYRVLHEFELNIEDAPEQDKTYKIDLIVGVNGTGKSTLMRLLAELFQRLANPSYPPPLFSFTLTYTLQIGQDQAQTIEISHNHEQWEKALASETQTQEQAKPYTFQLDNGTQQQVSAIDLQYLPNYIVVFSSGNQEGWEIVETMHNATGSNVSIPTPGSQTEKEALLALYNQEMKAPTAHTQTASNRSATMNDNRFLFVKNEHLPLIILCGLLADMQYESNPTDTSNPSQPNDKPQEKRILDDALQETRIKELHGFSLKFVKDATTQPRDTDLIQKFKELATYTVRYDPDGNEQLLFFELLTDEAQPRPNTSYIKNLLEISAGRPLELFRDLNRLRQSDDGTTKPILQDQDVQLFFDRLKKSDQATGKADAPRSMEEREPLHLLDWLSDGELSFLGRLCLFSMLRDSEALVLLDEPEVHFNDYWKHQLVARLSHSLTGSYSHVIMTTHSSITLSDVYDTNIHVMQRDGTFTNGTTGPSIQTFGTDPSDIIMSVFRAESATGAYSNEYIQQRINTLFTITNPTERRKKLDALAKQIGPSPWRYLIYREIMRLDNGKQNNRQAE